MPRTHENTGLVWFFDSGNMYYIYIILVWVVLRFAFAFGLIWFCVVSGGRAALEGG